MFIRAFGVKRLNQDLDLRFFSSSRARKLPAIIVTTISLRRRLKIPYKYLRAFGAREENGCGIQQQETEGASVRCPAQQAIKTGGGEA